MVRDYYLNKMTTSACEKKDFKEFVDAHSGRIVDYSPTIEGFSWIKKLLCNRLGVTYDSLVFDIQEELEFYWTIIESMPPEDQESPVVAVSSSEASQETTKVINTITELKLENQTVMPLAQHESENFHTSGIRPQPGVTEPIDIPVAMRVKYEKLSPPKEPGFRSSPTYTKPPSFEDHIKGFRISPTAQPFVIGKTVLSAAAPPFIPKM
jgi:hypothetical protein